MVESKYVLHGLIAGAVSGAVIGIITFIYMPSVEEVLKIAEQYTNFSGLSREVLKGYLSIVLLVSPIIAFVFSLLLGALFGALYDYLDKKIRVYVHVVVSALLTGAVFWTVLVAPNIVLGAGRSKIITNSIWAGVYTATLLILALIKNPRASDV